MKGDLFIKAHTGQYMVYPGHPLVLACAIMHVFDSLDAATDRSDGEYEAALSSSNIPGSGCHVNAALNVLKAGNVGGCPVRRVLWPHRRSMVR
jgi:hypothetical protein